MEATAMAQRLEGVIPAIRAQRAQIERERRLPGELVKALRQTRVCALEIPRALGGLEAEPREILEAIELISSGDGSTGWCMAQAISANGVAGFMTDAGAREVFADPATPSAGVFAPAGAAQRVEGGVRVRGRWQFASGVSHADWLFAGCLVMENGQPRMTAHGPEIIYVFLPAGSYEIYDTWFVSGLSGTGSHDIGVADAFVPAARVFTIGVPCAGRSEPLYRMPPLGWYVAHVAAVSLGIARAALDELTTQAQSKVPTFSQAVLAERPAAQLELARAEAALAGARAFLHASVDAMWRAVKAEVPVSLRQIALARVAAAQACEVGADVARRAGVLAGGSAIFTSASLQRHVRDAEAITHHFSVAPHVWEDAGRVFMGGVPAAPMF